MSIIHSLGFPRIGNKGQLKRALEQYWQGEISQNQLQNMGAQLPADRWQIQQQAGIDLVPIGNFAYCQPVFNTSLLFGVVPKRNQTADGQINFDCQFSLDRGRPITGATTLAGSGFCFNYRSTQ